jgi:hypothetical protein
MMGVVILAVALVIGISVLSRRRIEAVVSEPTGEGVGGGTPLAGLTELDLSSPEALISTIGQQLLGPTPERVFKAYENRTIRIGQHMAPSTGSPDWPDTVFGVYTTLTDAERAAIEVGTNAGAVIVTMDATFTDGLNVPAESVFVVTRIAPYASELPIIAGQIKLSRRIVVHNFLGMVVRAYTETVTVAQDEADRLMLEDERWKVVQA